MLDGRHPAPRLAAVAAAQTRLLWLLRRRGTLIFLALVSVQTVALSAFGIVLGVAIDTRETGRQIGFARVADLSESFGLSLDPGGMGLMAAFLAMILFAAFWPLSVWGDEPPRGRGYHRSLPVDRQLLDLVRVAAGAAGLTAAAAAAYGAALLAAALAGHTGSIGALPAAAWACLLLGPLVPYSLSSIAAVRSDRPAAWIWFGLGAPLLVATVGFGLELELLTDLVREITVGRWGVLHAAAGPVLGTIGGRETPPAGGWLAAWALWTLLAGAGLTAAAGRGRAR